MLNIDTNAKISIACPNGHINDTKLSEWQYDTEVVEKGDSQMGNEVIHRFSINDRDCCHTGCKQVINRRFEVYEYPSNSIEDYSIDASVSAADVRGAVQ